MDQPGPTLRTGPRRCLLNIWNCHLVVSRKRYPTMYATDLQHLSSNLYIRRCQMKQPIRATTKVHEQLFGCDITLALTDLGAQTFVSACWIPTEACLS